MANILFLSLNIWDSVDLFIYFAVDTAGQYLKPIALLTFIAETVCFF